MRNTARPPGVLGRLLARTFVLLSVVVGVAGSTAAVAGANDASPDPQALNFGPVTLGQTAPGRAVTFTLTFWLPSEIPELQVVVTGPGAAAFAVTSTDCPTATLVEPPAPQWGKNGSCTATVSFTPPVTGPQSATLVLKRGPWEEKATVALSGEGIEGPIPVIPETPLPLLLPLAAVAATGVLVWRRTSRRPS